VKYYQYKKKHLLPTIKRIPDDVWNEVKHILPKEKPRNTKGYPAAVPFRKALDGILSGWYFVCTENRLSVEGDAAQRIWLWFYLPQTIPAMG
jgi:hypothetical protein